MRGSVAKEGYTNWTQNGYHQTKHKGKMRYTHHLIAEEKLGRSLTDEEQAYFIDGNRKNLDPGNIGVRPIIKRRRQAMNSKSLNKLERIERLDLQERVATLEYEIERIKEILLNYEIKLSES